MRGILQTLKSAFGVDFERQARDEIRQDEDRAARDVVVLHVRGSIGIAKGAFQTRADLDHALALSGIAREAVSTDANPLHGGTQPNP
jgi:hypothetical protein